MIRWYRRRAIENTSASTCVSASLSTACSSPDSDLDMAIPNIDAQLYELSTDFIENRFPSASAPLSTRVRTIIERLLIKGDCSYGSVSSTLGMHPRTLQRRLRSET